MVEISRQPGQLLAPLRFLGVGVDGWCHHGVPQLSKPWGEGSELFLDILHLLDEYISEIVV